MITFFRKIRQKLLSDNRTTKYLIYAAGEIILVMIGILLALQVNNWNEHRKLKIEEIKLLKEIISALESDKADIISNIDEHESAAHSCSIISEFIAERVAYHDSLKYHFSGALNTTRFGHTSGPYQTLKMKGPEIIENDSLRILLSEYYEKMVGYQFDLQSSSLLSYDRAKERQFELFKGFHIYEGIIPIDYKSLQKNTYYKSWIENTLDERLWEVKNFRLLKEKNEELSNFISREIKKNS